MKKLRFFLVMMLVCLTTGLSAQTIRNANNVQVGKIESDGTVRDANNSRMGSASGVNKKYAAAFFFFDFF